MVANKQSNGKKNKEGYCNICGQYSQLTRDHIPPQGCVKPRPVELTTLTQHLAKPNGKKRISQSGLNVRSICGNCNNNLLGAKYDPELIDLSQKATSIFRSLHESGLSLPAKIDLSVKPHKLIRAVIGHILAGKSPTTKRPTISAPFPDTLKNYFLNPSSNIPDEIEIYYWIYPSNRQIVINSLGVGSTTGEGNIAGSCLLKFFPLAFWVVFDKPNSFPINLASISKSKFKGLDDSCDIELDLQNIPHLDYPEVPSEGRYIMGRDDSTFLARPKRPKGFG